MRHTTRDLVSHRKSSYKWIRNRNKVLEASPGPATRAFLEPPTVRPHGSLTKLLQLKMLWTSPSTLGFAAARGPTPEILIRSQEWEAQPGPSNKDDANTGTASPLKTYLKDRDAAHQEGLYQRIHLWTRLSGLPIRILHLTFGPASDEVTLAKQEAWEIS